jgi:hypothetical protein
VVYRRESGSGRLRPWAAREKAPAAAPPGGLLIAELSDGPLEGSTREVSAVEGRPPKTIDIVSGERTLRYCLAAWEQSGHTAVYGFLYDV